MFQNRAPSALVRANFLGQLQNYDFDAVTISAGGINSPLILKRSGIDGAMVGLNLTDHPMGFVAKITKYDNSDNFGLLATNSRELHPFEPMLKICDSQTGLWTAFYLRPTSTATIKSDPYAAYHKMLSSRSIGRKFLARLAQFGDADFRSQVYAHVFGRTISGRHAYVLAVSEQGLPRSLLN